MKELIKKDYKLQLAFDFPKRRFFKKVKMNFKYKQGTLKDILEMTECVLSGDGLIEWLYRFLVNNQIKGDRIRLSKKYFYQLSDQKVTEIVEVIQKSFAYKYFEQKQGSKKVSLAPSSSFICLLLTHTNESIESLMDLTWEQIDYLVEGVVWNQNEQTKKGQNRNKANAVIKEARAEMNDEDALKKAKQMEERLKKADIKFAKDKKNGRTIQSRHNR